MVKEKTIRKTSTKKYIFAFVLAVAIFLLGILLGSFLAGERVNYFQDFSDKQKLDYESLQLQLFYMSSMSNKSESCNTFSKILEQSLEDVGNAQEKVEQYSKQYNKPEYSILKREYSLAQIRYWILNEEVKKSCETNTISLLYFYSNDCNDCKTQETILLYLKDKFKQNLLIFSVDAGFTEEPIISLLKEKYNINTTPSIVIGDKTLSGIVTKEDLFKEICSAGIMNGECSAENALDYSY